MYSCIETDRSFIRDIATDPGDAAIVRTIIAMARNLDMEVIAEGVETAEQLEFLRNEGYNIMQGYYLSRPAAAEELDNLLTGK